MAFAPRPELLPPPPPPSTFPEKQQRQQGTQPRCLVLAFVAKEGSLPWELPDASENAWTMFEDVLLAFETSSLNFARRIVIVEPLLIDTGSDRTAWRALVYLSEWRRSVLMWVVSRLHSDA
jgi:hypothetical protein